MSDPNKKKKAELPKKSQKQTGGQKGGEKKDVKFKSTVKIGSGSQTATGQKGKSGAVGQNTKSVTKTPKAQPSSKIQSPPPATPKLKAKTSRKSVTSQRSQKSSNNSITHVIFSENDPIGPSNSEILEVEFKDIPESSKILILRKTLAPGDTRTLLALEDLEHKLKPTESEQEELARFQEYKRSGGKVRGGLIESIHIENEDEDVADENDDDYRKKK